MLQFPFVCSPLQLFTESLLENTRRHAATTSPSSAAGEAASSSGHHNQYVSMSSGLPIPFDPAGAAGPAGRIFVDTQQPRTRRFYRLRLLPGFDMRIGFDRLALLQVRRIVFRENSKEDQQWAFGVDRVY